MKRNTDAPGVDPGADGAWRILLLDRASLATVRQAPVADIAEPEPAGGRKKKRRKSLMRRLAPVIRVFAVVLGAVTVLGLAVGVADAFSRPRGRGR